MRIFLSYPSGEHAAVEPVALLLRNAGHDVFLDKTDLPAGLDFNEQITDAVARSDMMIFFITPDSVAHGRFTLTELAFAQRKWPGPAGRVQPVMLRPTPIADIPAYLRSVQILTPVGNLAAEVGAAIAAMVANTGGDKHSRGKHWVWLFAGATMVLAASVAVWWFMDESTLACAYRQGPKAGMVEIAPWGNPAPAGSPCLDYLGSAGVFVTTSDARNGKPIDAARFTKRCQFNAGPRAGQTDDMTMALFFGIGAGCFDGAGSTGVGVP